MLKASDLPARTGVGFKPAHFGDILAGPQPIGFFEVHAENYMGAGGPPHAQLGCVARALCAVGAWRRAVDRLDATARSDHLARLKALCDRYAPESFSEHLAWSSHDGVYLNDLLPLPYTQADADAGRRACRRGADGARTPDAARKSVDLHSFFRKHDPGGRFPQPRSRSEPAAACCSTSTTSSCRHKNHATEPAGLSRLVSARPGEGNPSRRA